MIAVDWNEPVRSRTSPERVAALMDAMVLDPHPATPRWCRDLYFAACHAIAPTVAASILAGTKVGEIAVVIAHQQSVLSLMMGAGKGALVMVTDRERLLRMLALRQFTPDAGESLSAEEVLVVFGHPDHPTTLGSVFVDIGNANDLDAAEGAIIARLSPEDELRGRCETLGMQLEGALLGLATAAREHTALRARVAELEAELSQARADRREAPPPSVEAPARRVGVRRG